MKSALDSTHTINRYTAILLCALALFSCKKKTIEGFDDGRKYFPLTSGNWVIYEVDSIVYDGFTQSVDTIEFELRVRVGKEFTDGEGSQAFEIERAYKLTDSSLFVVADIWHANYTTGGIEQVEENKRIVKMALPPLLSSTWDGNAKNTDASWVYHYRFIHDQQTVNGLNFDSVCSVIQFDDEDIILTQRQYSEEQYAAGVGLVYHRKIWLDKKFNSSTGLYEPDDGYDVRWVVKSYSIQ